MEHAQNNKIYIPELLCLLLRRWKWLLAAALVGALILGGIRLGIAGAVLNDPEHLSKAVEKNVQDTEKYEAEKLSAQQQIAALRESIARRQTYLDNSVLMSLDPYEHNVGSLLVQIRADSQSQPDGIYQGLDPADSVVAAYGAAVRSSALLSQLSVKAGVSDVYIAELIAVQTDLETNSLKVQLKHRDGQLLEQLLQLVAAHLEKLPAELAEPHTAQIVSMGIRSSMDLELQTKQTEARAELDALLKSLAEVRTRQDNLEEPCARPVTWLQALGRSGLFALLGAAAGAVLFALAYSLYAAGCEKQLSGRMLRDAGLPVLSCDEPERLVLELQNRCPTGLLVAEKLPAHLETALKAAMPETVLTRELLHSAEALKALTACRGVVLTVPYGCSLEILRQQQQLLADYEKQLIGCVFLDDRK